MQRLILRSVLAAALACGALADAPQKLRRAIMLEEVAIKRILDNVDSTGVRWAPPALLEDDAPAAAEAVDPLEERIAGKVGQDMGDMFRGLRAKRAQIDRELLSLRAERTKAQDPRERERLQVQISRIAGFEGEVDQHFRAVQSLMNFR
mmetsp:Transcript_66966/g.174262  ORF Transcript_66966/g.174262 Transcript_66966/m.174262 type:complete len:149 (+) Transcript_66966:64-510(+)